MRTSRPDESQLMCVVFDLQHQDGVDLRGMPPGRAPNLKPIAFEGFYGCNALAIDDAMLPPTSLFFRTRIARCACAPDPTWLERLRSPQLSPWHGARAAQAHRHLGAGDRRVGILGGGADQGGARPRSLMVRQSAHTGTGVDAWWLAPNRLRPGPGFHTRRSARIARDRSASLGACTGARTRPACAPF
jgi:hypothetical protein